MKQIKRLLVLIFVLSLFFIVDINAAGPGDPVIYFNGGKYVELTQGGTYTEQGVFAIDAQDGTITDYEVSGEVDNTVPGQYVLTYSVEDSDGNVATDSRLVVVTPFGQDLNSNPQDVFSIGEILNWGGDSSDVITASTETSDGFVIVIQVETDEIVGNPIADYIGIENNNANLANLSNVVVKYDNNYKVVWAEIIGSQVDDRINKIVALTDDTFVFVGNSGSYGNGGSTNTLYQNATIDNANGDENDANGMDALVGQFTRTTQIDIDWVNNIAVTGALPTHNKQLTDVIIDDDGSIVVAGSVVRNQHTTDRAFFQKFTSAGTRTAFEYIDNTYASYNRSVNGRIVKLSSGYVLFTFRDIDLKKTMMTTSTITVDSRDSRAIKVTDDLVLDGSGWDVVVERMNIKDAIVADDGNIIIVGDDYVNTEIGTYKNTHPTVFGDPIHHHDAYAQSIVMKIDVTDGSRLYAYKVGGDSILDSGGNQSSESGFNYDDRIFSIENVGTNEYVMFGKTRSSEGFEVDSASPYSNTYSVWAVAITDDTVGDTITFDSNITLHSNLDANYNSVIKKGSTYLVAFSSEGQFNAAVRDNDDYDSNNENDVFIAELELTNSSSVTFAAPVVEEVVSLDEELSGSDINDLIDDSTGSIEVDNDIDVVYSGPGSLTYVFEDSTFDKDVPGVYTVPYYVYDNDKNASSGELIITINDITPPTLEFTRLRIEVGDNPDFLEGVTLTDEGDDTLTLNDIIIDEGIFDEDVIDDYDITYTVTDASGNERVAVREVEVVDEIGLEIEFDGDLIIEVGTLLPNYLEGVDISGNRGVDVSLSDVSVNTAPVNLTQVGVYEVKYTVDTGDRSGDARRNVRVVDTTAPLFEINTEMETTLPVDSEEPNWLDYMEVSDNYDSDPEVTFVDNVVYHKTGDYLVVFTARDDEGNESYYQLEVVIGDLEAPTIELKGDMEVSVEVYRTYEEAGFTVIDNYDSADDIEIEIVDEIIYTNGQLDTVGTYRIKYTAIDKGGNRSETVERIVHVTDTEAPTITGIEFKEAVRTEEIDFLEGISITDNYDEEIIITEDDITRVADLTKPNGNYIVTITARDSSGNTSTFSYGLYVVNEDAQVSGYIMGAAVVILLGGGILMATRKQ